MSDPTDLPPWLRTRCPHCRQRRLASHVARTGGVPRHQHPRSGWAPLIGLLCKPCRRKNREEQYRDAMKEVAAAVADIVPVRWHDLVEIVLPRHQRTPRCAVVIVDVPGRDTVVYRMVLTPGRGWVVAPTEPPRYFS